MKTKSKSLNIRLSDQEHQDLKTMATAQKISVSALLRRVTLKDK
jgi:predicted HicB family RNase H-like nuclease